VFRAVGGDAGDLRDVAALIEQPSDGAPEERDATHAVAVCHRGGEETTARSVVVGVMSLDVETRGGDADRNDAEGHCGTIRGSVVRCYATRAVCAVDGRSPRLAVVAVLGDVAAARGDRHAANEAAGAAGATHLGGAGDGGEEDVGEVRHETPTQKAVDGIVVSDDDYSLTP
jgi:hypothetical protein